MILPGNILKNWLKFNAGNDKQKSIDKTHLPELIDFLILRTLSLILLPPFPSIYVLSFGILFCCFLFAILLEFYLFLLQSYFPNENFLLSFESAHDSPNCVEFVQMIHCCLAKLALLSFITFYSTCNGFVSKKLSTSSIHFHAKCL